MDGKEANFNTSFNHKQMENIFISYVNKERERELGLVGEKLKGPRIGGGEVRIKVAR